MRLLFLCKRRPQGRDLLTRPYGRFFYLPYHLVEQGFKVTILLLDYEDSDPVYQYEHNIEWYTVSLRGLLTLGPMAYVRQAQKLIISQKPDWIIGFSDTWYGILAVYLGRKNGVKTLVDAYDNYESYIPWLKPLHWLWRYALRHATALSAAGPQLAELMSQNRQDHAEVVPMAADPIFRPIDDLGIKKQLGLPEDVPLIGYCGSFYKNRGIQVIFQAMELLLDKVPGAKLVISGRRDSDFQIPISIQESVIQLGYLPDEQMPLLLNALDVLMVININSAFGKYSYPVKLYEAMRCNKPVVASNVKGTHWILREHPECLVESGNYRGLADRLIDALSRKQKLYNRNNGWESSAILFRHIIANKTLARVTFYS